MAELKSAWFGLNEKTQKPKNQTDAQKSEVDKVFDENPESSFSNMFTPRWFTGAGTVGSTIPYSNPNMLTKTTNENTSKVLDEFKNKLETEDKRIDSNIKMASPEVLDPAFKVLNTVPMQSSKELASGLEEWQWIKDKLAADRGQMSPNLMPLMAYSDRQFGGNLAKYYTPPTTNAEYAQLEGQLEKGMQGTRQDLSAADLNLLKQMLSGETKVIQGDTKSKEQGGQQGSTLGTTVVNIPPQLAPGKATGTPVTKEPTQAQYKDAYFGNRLRQADEVFAKMQAEKYDRTNIKQGLASMSPIEAIKPEKLKQWEQAELNFVNALLRQESGAVIGDPEHVKAEKQYFPRPGDSKELLQQKKQNRQQVFESFKVAAGPAWGKTPQVPGAAVGDYAPTLPDGSGQSSGTARDKAKGLFNK